MTRSSFVAGVGFRDPEHAAARTKTRTASRDMTPYLNTDNWQLTTDLPKAIMAAMTRPEAEEGSVGVVPTEYVDLPVPLALDCGRELHPVRIAYETYGTLTPEKDNVILVCHALSGDAHAAGWSAVPTEESALDGFRADERDIGKKSGLGWWDGMIGPGKAFDTNRYFVVATNLIGGCRGATGPSSLNPGTGKPYGLHFSPVAVAGMVGGEPALPRGPRSGEP